jgi:photoactive yellow protein
MTDVARPESLETATVDIFALDSYDDSQLDDLPFGVICLDESGTIVRYNLAEARLARLDRNRVLGKDFFRRIAPCTAVPDFEGRFRAFVGGRDDRLVFPFTFDFAFGAQHVTIEVVRATRPFRYYICVNRVRFLPARPEFARVAAPRQAELTPDEGAAGVRRDHAEQRVVELSAANLRGLRLAWDRVAPQGWSLFSSEWGFRWGRLAVIDVETEIIEQRDASLRDLPLDDALEVIGGYLRRQGWGVVDIDASSAAATARGAAVIYLEHSALAECAGGSTMPRCQLIAGVLRAMLSHVSQRMLAVTEVCCVAQGAPRCEMLAVAHSRRALLEAAATGASSAREALQRLDPSSAGAPRAGDVLARLF